VKWKEKPSIYTIKSGKVLSSPWMKVF